MTNRLYYTDAYLQEFEATLLEIIDLGDRQAAILDRTAFYPTSGGQPFDTGTLGTSRVTDVIDREDGTILHVFDGVLDAGSVHGRIDWDRRFEHMQQHTGQHVLSAAFEHVCHARTESFHLGTRSSTIDLARELSPTEIAAAELEANTIVWEDRQVLVQFVEEDQAAALALRKDPKRTGVLRIVEIQGFDRSACGGTHVSRTGAIGNIVVASSERFRGGSRVEFLCGIRTLHGYRALRQSMSAAGRLLSTAVDDVPDAIERFQSESKVARSRIKDLQERLARHEASAMSARASAVDGITYVIESVDGWDMPGMKSIAMTIVERPGHVAVLLGGSPASIVAARAANVPVDAAAIVKAAASQFGGKGGGKPELAQGGGLNAPPADVARFVARELNVLSE